MLVRNGVIEKCLLNQMNQAILLKFLMQILLKYLKPNWTPKPSVSIFTKPGCPYCAKAKALLKLEGYSSFEEIVLGRDVQVLFQLSHYW